MAELSEKIRKEAQDILDSFSSELAKIGGKLGKESLVQREKGEREESLENGEKNEIDREIMFENAPNKNEGFIIAEKGKW